MPKAARFAIGGVALALLVTVAALFVGGGRPEPAPAGIPDAGLVVEWALPLARLVADLAAAVTVGLLLMAAAFIPSTKEVLSRGARQAARTAMWTASAWVAAAAALALLTLSDVLALPLAEVLRPSVLVTYLPDLPSAAAWTVTAALAALAAVAAAESRRPSGAWGITTSVTCPSGWAGWPKKL